MNAASKLQAAATTTKVLNWQMTKWHWVDNCEKEKDAHWI